MSAGAPVQNIYDDPAFFAGYAQLRERGAGLNEVLEQPALMTLLPPSLQGLRVLDLGCGFGDFARAARRGGAREVLALDVSQRMLAVARERTDDAGIAYQACAIEALPAEGTPFDLVVSSLALHYVADHRGALARIAARMAPGARLAFSVEHPLCTALPQQQWQRDAEGRALHWPVDGYQDEGPRRTHWFVDGVVKHHRTAQSWVDALLDAGLRLVRLLEPAPLPEALARDPALALHRRRPPFLLLAAERPAQ